MTLLDLNITNGVHLITSGKFLSVSDNPEVGITKKLSKGKKYKITGRLKCSSSCCPQPTLKTYSKTNSKARLISMEYFADDNSFKTYFEVDEDVNSVLFSPFFQRGDFELFDFKITEVNSLVFKYYLFRKMLVPYYNKLKSRFNLLFQGVVFLIKKGPKRTYHRLLKEIRKSYKLWIVFYDSQWMRDRSEIINSIKFFKINPKFSIVMPVYNVDRVYLEAAIESVFNQLYTNWELCLADDCSTFDYIKPFLKELMAKDSRVKVIFRETNGHISEATNSALSIATGDFIVLMDNDDIIPNHALFEVAKVINNHPNVALIYTDEDKITEKGDRFAPFFKPDWSPELFLSMNILTHLNVFKADIVKEIGGFRKGFEGSQDYDFCLRFIDKIRDEQIVHIPKILYHWRAIEGSVALDSREKQYAHDAARRAIHEYLERRNIKANVVSGYGPLHRVVYDYDKIACKVSIIICTRDSKDILKNCIDSILNLTSYENYEIIIINNSSVKAETFEYFEEVSKNSKIRVINIDYEFNYSYLNNQAVNYATGNILCFLNNDIEVITPNWLDELVMHVQREEIGAVGAKLHYPVSKIQHYGIITGLVGGVAGHQFKYFSSNSEGYFGRLKVVCNVSAVTGACLLVRKKVFEQVGGLDEINLKVAYNDVDFCLKVLNAGYRIVVTPFAELIHHESLTRGAEDTPEKVSRLISEQNFMKSKWKSKLEDRYYNPNLTLEFEDYALAWPPNRHF